MPVWNSTNTCMTKIYYRKWSWTVGKYSKHKTPARIQLLIMFLHKHDFVANYSPCKGLVCSHTLCRALLKKQTPEISEAEVSCKVHSVISSFPISTEILKQLRIRNAKRWDTATGSMLYSTRITKIANPVKIRIKSLLQS